ncbi:hypothetical protein CS063_11605 [Sporanaerobium hydrogeniformans]|uniref:Uncharacterized protein n=1 Tax=Sporanaerobium hydrogeniformans TaxID=3072179 RepID=A0AC61DCG4_9FIRM|nr:histidine kinase [Sporanaerobium hydrogeniformans]PHV70307.1 hypothetical protein CS063_11605 [Sporanaerobium hydrogeniformans]
MSKSRMSTKLAALYIVFTTLLVVVGIMAFYRYGYSNAYSQGVSNISQIVETVMKQIDSRLQTMDAVTVEVLTEGTFMTMWRKEMKDEESIYSHEIRQILMKAYMNRSDIRRVAVYTLHGEYFSTGKTTVTKEDVLKRIKMIQGKYMMNKMSSRAFVSLHYDHWDTTSDTQVFSLIKPIKDREGNTLGYIEVQQNALYIREICNVKWNDYLLDVVVFMSNGEDVFYATFDEDEREKINRLKAATKQYSKVRHLRNQVVFTSSSNYYEGRAVIALEEAILMEAFNRAMKLMILIALGLMLLTILFCILAVKSVIKPIHLLVQHMEHIDMNHLNKDLNIKMKDYETAILVGAFQKMSDRIQEYILTQKKMESVQTKTLFNALQSEMGPHFLYNSLGSIANMCEEGETEMAADACYSLTEILRYVSSYEMSEVTIGEEMEKLRSYMAIMKSRYRHRLEFELHVDEEAKDIIIPKLTYQPIVENAIKYSLMENENVIVKVFTVLLGERLYIEVKDNGCGITKEAGEKIQERINEFFSNEDVSEIVTKIQFGGLGLSGTLIRLSIFYGESFQYELQEKNDVGGTSIILSMNIKEFR